VSTTRQVVANKKAHHQDLIANKARKLNNLEHAKQDKHINDVGFPFMLILSLDLNYPILRNIALHS